MPILDSAVARTWVPRSMGLEESLPARGVVSNAAMCPPSPSKPPARPAGHRSHDRRVPVARQRNAYVTRENLRQGGSASVGHRVRPSSCASSRSSPHPSNGQVTINGDPLIHNHLAPARHRPPADDRGISRLLH
jgi:hypothetical protein